MKNFLEKVQKNRAERDKRERVTGLGRRTREEIAQWNQALRFQTQGGHQTSPASLQGGGGWGGVGVVNEQTIKLHTQIKLERGEKKKKPKAKQNTHTP